MDLIAHLWIYNKVVVLNDLHMALCLVFHM